MPKYILNLLFKFTCIFILVSIFFLVYRDFAFQSIANLSKNTASVAWGRKIAVNCTHIQSQG